MKVLITSGGTRVPIDGIRYIGNTSSGKTGVQIAEHFSRSGWDTTLLKAEDSFSSENMSIEEIEFTDFESLRDSLQKELRTHYDAVIHLAAVSDYFVSKVTNDSGGIIDRSHKIKSGEPIQLHLSPTPKILDSLKEYSVNKSIAVVGFKLTNDASFEDAQAIAREAASNPNIDILVHNHLPMISDNSHLAWIYRKDQTHETNTKAELAQTLNRILKDTL